MKLKQIVVFAILMENDDGILGKSPCYIAEKYESCSRLTNPKCLLDTSNATKFDRYMKIWRVE